MATLTATDFVTLFDAGASIATLTPTQFGSLGTNGIDVIDASDNILTLTLQQYQVLNVPLTGADTVTVSLTTAEFNGLAASGFTAFGANLVDILDVDGSGTNSAVFITEAKAAALVNTAGLSIAANDIVTLSDTGSNLALLTASQLVSVSRRDFIDHRYALFDRRSTWR